MKLTRKETQNLTRSIRSKETERVVKNCPQRKAEAQVASLLKSAKYLKEK